MGSALIAQGKPLMVGNRLLMLYPAVVSASPLTALQLVDYVVGQSLANPVVQRKAGTHSDADPGYADAPFVFTYAGGSPGGVQARVLSKDNPTIVIRDWVTLTDLHLDANGTTGWGRAPGVPAGADYIWEIKDPASGLTSRGTQRWGVGVCILAEGQSNMVQTLQMGDYASIVPGTSTRELEYFISAAAAGSVFGTSGFVAMTNLGGTGTGNTGCDNGVAEGGVLSLVRIAASALKQKYGRKIPVGLILSTRQGTSLAAWIPGGDRYEGLFNGTGPVSGPVSFKSPKQYWAGDFEIVGGPHQGEADQGLTRAARLVQLKAYCQARFDYVAQFGRTPAQLAILPAILGSYNTGAGVPGIDNIRAAVFDLWTYAQANGWSKVRPGWCCIDLLPPTNNALHMVGETQTQSQRRLAQSVVHELVPSLAPSSGMGPRITSIVRGAGLTATVTVAHDGGTQLVGLSGGAAITGFTANTAADFSGAPITVGATIASPTTITLTFSQLPAYVHYLHGMTPDISNAAIDNTVYPSTCINPSTDVRTGLPVVITPDPYLVN